MITSQIQLHNFLCLKFVVMHSAQPTSPLGHLSCSIQKSVGKLWLSLFWVTCTLRAEVPWLAAASECAQLRTPRRSPLLPPLHPLQFCVQLTPLPICQCSPHHPKPAFQKLPPVSCRVPLAWPTHCSCQTLPHSVGCPLGITAQTAGLGI